MSDKEKKDIDDLEKLEKETKIELLRKAIKKQEKGYGKGFFDGQMNERRFWIDRIKNKIEKVKDGTFDAEIVLNQLLDYYDFQVTITKEKLENEYK